MAKFEIEGLDEVSLALRSVIDGVEDFNIELAQEAADITKEEIEKNIKGTTIFAPARSGGL